VSQQVVLTSHLLQPVFFDIAKPAWDKLAPDVQTKLRAAAVTALKGNDEARLADEARIVEDLKSRGLTVTTVDLDVFRKKADEVYGASPDTKAWDKALMKEAME